MNKHIRRIIDRYPKNIRAAFLKGFKYGKLAKNPYNNTSKLNGAANYGKAFFNAFRYGQRLSEKYKKDSGTFDF